MLRLENITKTYLGQSTPALAPTNLEITTGEFVMLFGQSGSGKSTLLHLISTMDRPSEGQLFFDRDDITKIDQKSLSRHRLANVGVVFQNFYLFSDLSALQNVMLPLKFAGVPVKEQRFKAMKALTEVGLADKAEKMPKNLSGGEQQRVAIARALVNQPKLLICDEPTGNLDSQTAEKIMWLLRKLNQRGQTIIMATHNLNHTWYATREIEMLDGHLLQDNTKAGLGLNQIEIISSPSSKMGFWSKASLALNNLNRKRFRVLLSSLGVAIGLACFLCLYFLTEGLRQSTAMSIADPEILAAINSLFRTIEIVFGFLGGIILLVAIIGIANTMILTLIQRTKEIGIMKAIGASNHDVMGIFLIESSLIGLIGGLDGFVSASFITKIIEFLINFFWLGETANKIHFPILLLPSLLAVICAIALAALAGLWPARRAAALDPIRALKEE